MLSGRTSSLLEETSRIFKLYNSPMESGSDSKRLEERFNSSRLLSPAIESGIICFPRINKPKISQNEEIKVPDKQEKRNSSFRISNFHDQCFFFLIVLVHNLKNLFASTSLSWFDLFQLKSHFTLTSDKLHPGS